MTTATLNSFLHPVEELHFGTYRPEDVPDALESTRALAEQRHAELLAVPAAERTFANTVLAFTRAADEFEAVVGRVFHLSGVLPGWGQAEAEVAAAAADFGNQIAFSADLYRALRQFRESSAETLALNERRLLTELIEQYERDGVGLPADAQEELRGLRARISELMSVFKGNVIEAANTAGLRVDDAAELAGLSTSFVARCRAAAEERGEEGYWVAYSQPAYTEVVTSCSVRATREQMYLVHVALAGDTNTTVATEILALRRRQAQILGFADFTDLVTVERMAGSGERVAEFLTDLERRYAPLAKAEHHALQEYARAVEDDQHLELSAADVDTGLYFYYANRLYGETVGIDPSTLREYLPLPQVVEETFAIFTTLYGLTFTSADVPVWHGDVTAYNVHSEDGRHLAVMFADWVARPDKRSGAWKNDAYVPPRGKADNGRPYLGYMVFNFTPAEPGEPVLCTPNDAQTVLHELGHFVHEVVSTTELREQAGTTCRWDFVEAPSQIMENWFWQPEVLGRMARHWRTGEPLPADTVQRLLDSRSFRVGSAAVRQLYLATMDFEMHRLFEGGDLLAFARAVKQRFLVAPVSPLDALPASFQHVFAGGYAAGYYSYKWAEVIEAALFDRFAREGVLNPQTGRAYARDVLARGSEVEPGELIEAFLGGPATPDAMLRRDGLAV